MRRLAGDLAAVDPAALMGGDGVHRGRLADDAAARLDAPALHRRDQMRYAEAAELLVIGERHMDRLAG